MKKIKIFAILLLISLLGFAPVNAAINSFHGGISAGANYTSNADRTANNENSEWESTINPFLSYTREVATGRFFVKYAPTLRYNFDSDDTTGDHRVSLGANQEHSDRLSSSINNTFVYTSNYWDNQSTPVTENDINLDDSVLPPDENTRLSEKVGTQKLLSNYFSASMAYEFAKNSLLNLGYNNRILDYDTSDENDYMYHNPSIGLSYSFGPQWSSSLNYSYTTADYDTSEKDFDSHKVSTNLKYTYSTKDSISAGLSYYEKKYDNEGVLPTENNDYYIITANLGWDHAFTPQTKLSLSAGPSYIDEDDKNDTNTTLDYNATLSSRFQQGSWYISGNGGYDDRAFDGANETLSEYYRIGAGFNYKLMKDLSANLSGSFRNDKNYNDSIGNYNEDTLSASTGLKYSFGKWYYISARYSYSEVDSDLDSDDYTDHRVFINLGFSKELKRWQN